MTIFRYPGGKTKLQRPIVESIKATMQEFNVNSYREAFLGGGSISLAVLNEVKGLEKIWVNDANIALASLWSSMILYPDDLAVKIQNFVPSVEGFFQHKAILLDDHKWSDDRLAMVQLGFYELAIHQTSYSGMGTKSGGPLGGRHQTPESNLIASRWSPKRLIGKIQNAHTLFNSVTIEGGRCTAVDFETVLDEQGEAAFIYLDPPYFVMGNDLYRNGFSEHDHRRLADLLQNTKHHWLLSYDDCPEIRELYSSWATIKQVDVQYSMNGSRKKPELLITPPYKRSFVGGWGYFSQPNTIRVENQRGWLPDARVASPTLSAS